PPSQFSAHPTHSLSPLSHVFFFNDPPTTDIYTLSLHDALPISEQFPYTTPAGWEYDSGDYPRALRLAMEIAGYPALRREQAAKRSEEHTSELQSLTNLVCRLLLEKKKANNDTPDASTAPNNT